MNEFKLSKQNQFYVLYFESLKIKNKFGYYSKLAESERQFTLSIIKKISINCKYIDACCSTGIRGMYALKAGFSTIFNDLYVKPALIQLNLKLNGFKQGYKIYNEDVTYLSKNLPTESILDLDVYGNSVRYLEKLLKKDFKYLFLTFTDLMNLCGWGAKQFFQKYNLKFTKSEPKYELAVRLIMQIVKTITQKEYRIIAIYRKQKYFRVYLEETVEQQLYVSGFLCSCGIFDIKEQFCKLCQKPNSLVGPLYSTPICGIPAFGFNKIRVFKKFKQLPKNESLIAYFNNKNIPIFLSNLDKDYFRGISRLQLYDYISDLTAQ